jgi:DNA processing protein
VDGVGPRRAEALRRAFDEIARERRVEREKELIEKRGVSLLAVDEPGYPALLRHINDAPPLLFVRGSIRAEDGLALGVVGSRKCTHYGREQADRFAAQCSQAGLTIVSGGAYGVDAAAHHAAVRVGGRTLAVIGSGLDQPYPPEHGELFDRITADGGEHGAVVSELPMSAPPIPQNFPARNRIISGLSLGVLVVEASQRSGALITARLAAEDHGREVMAVPGRVDSDVSSGCHKIIREGWATLVTSAADVLDALGDAGQTLKGAVASNPAAGGANETATDASLFEANLTESQRKIVAAIGEGADEFDRLAAATGLAASTLQADLTMLQIRGLVTRDAGRIARKTGR